MQPANGPGLSMSQQAVGRESNAHRHNMMAIQITTLPIIVYHFRQLSLVTLLSNFAIWAIINQGEAAR